MRTGPDLGIRPRDIRTIRRGLGLSRRDFADLLWLSYESGERTIENWETGKTTPIGPALLAMLALRDGWRPPSRIKLLKTLRTQDPKHPV